MFVRLLPLLCLVVAPAAFAVKPGEALFIRVKDAKLLGAADVKAQPLRLLLAGEKVTWRGAEPSQRHLHRVDVVDPESKATVSGWVLQANLSPRPPAMEVLEADTGQPIDAQAFKSSGAATKAVGGLALTWAANKKLTGLPERLMAAEAISASVSDERLVTRAKELGLPALELEVPPPAESAAPEAPPAPVKKKRKKAKR